MNATQTLPLEQIVIQAQYAGNIAVETFLLTHREPMYCGSAYLYSVKPKPRTRTNKVVVDQKYWPTGFCARSQSLDLHEIWCDAAEKVFKANGIEVRRKSWVD